MWVVPLVLMFVFGCVIGSTRSRDLYKITGLLIVTIIYGVWQFYAMGDVDFSHPLSPAMVDFFGRVVVFFIMGVGGCAITNALRLTESKSR